GGPIELKGPDLEKGVAEASFGDNETLLGHAAGEPVLLVRRGTEVLAIGAVCTHYSGPLAEGIVVGDTVLCPLHHACFDLRTGQPSTPAFNPVPCFTVERRDKTLFVTGKLPTPVRAAADADFPSRIVIIGGGAAGHAAVEALRTEGYAGSLVLVSADSLAP